MNINRLTYSYLLIYLYTFIYLLKFSTYDGSGLRTFYVHPLAIDVMFVLS